MTFETVPKLTDLMADPGKVSMLPSDAIPPLLGELERVKASLWARLTVPQSNGQGRRATFEPSEFPVIESEELARRWNVPESCIRDSVRARSGDPIPCVRMGRYVLFEWGSPELQAWFERRKDGKKKSLDKRNVLVYQ